MNKLGQAVFERGFVNSSQVKPFLEENSHFPFFIVAGRSNVGKSTFINAFFGRKTARTSKTPGRTQEINIFRILNSDQETVFFLVDLPGFGHAQVSKSKRKEWDEAIMALFESTQKGLILHIQDARHPLQQKDQEFLGWLPKGFLPTFVVFNKIDKLSNQKEKNHLKKMMVSKDLKKAQQVYAVSALKGEGVEKLKEAFENELYKN